MKQKGGSSFCPFLSVNALIFPFSTPSEGQLGGKGRKRLKCVGKPRVLATADQYCDHGLMELGVLDMCISPLDLGYLFTHI